MRRVDQQNKAVRSIGANSARVIKVIEVVMRAGKGTEEDPNRLVTQYWSLDGKLLATVDSFG